MEDDVIIRSWSYSLRQVVGDERIEIEYGPFWSEEEMIEHRNQTCAEIGWTPVEDWR